MSTDAMHPASRSGPPSSEESCVVKVDRVSKTYCRNLRRSLWYGAQDIFREMTFRSGYAGPLRRDEFEAVTDASFEVYPGECVALLGPNGAGKSSMLKMINGILRPTKGEIRIRGRIGALIELGTGFNPVLTGRENVFINASILGFSRQETEERFDEILEFAEIGEFIDAPVRTYSSGMKVRLGFAVASHLAPDLMLIDEVLAVGDLAFRIKCYDHLQQRVASGVAVVLVSHIVSMMPRFCTRAIVFDRGSIVFDGDILDGIAQYQKILGIEKAKLKGLRDEDIADRKGVSELEDEMAETPGPEVAIQEARTLNQKLEPSEKFRTGEPVVVEVVLKADRDFRDCKLVLNLDSASFGVVACMPSQRTGFTFDLPAGEPTRVRVRLPELPLIEGGYAFHVTLYGPGKSSLLDQKSALAPFQIANPDQRPRALKGILVLDHQWSIAGRPDEK